MTYRENLQLHTIGLVLLHDNGTAILDQFGETIPTYDQKHIFESAKVSILLRFCIFILQAVAWNHLRLSHHIFSSLFNPLHSPFCLQVFTSFYPSVRRGNYEDLDNGSNGNSYLDPLQITSTRRSSDNRDWFPKIVPTGGYLGDQVPLCDDLPSKPFLRKGAKYRLLGGSSRPLWHYEVDEWDQDKEVRRMTLDSSSDLYNELCKPQNPPPRASTLQSGSGTASFNSSLWGAPFCSGSNTQCDSGTLLEGNDGIKECGNNETSCTIDNCEDGSIETPASESVKRIVVESVNTGDPLRGGTLARIRATVIANSLRDKVDFYFTEDASSVSPQWIFITTVAAQLEGTETEQVVSFPRNNTNGEGEIRFTLPKCTLEAGCKQVS